MKSLRIQKKGGFTLLEVLATVAIISILLTAAAPSFQLLIQNNRMASRVNDFSSSLHLTRRTAIARNTRVSICPSNAAGDACDAGQTDWNAHGLLVFSDHASGTQGAIDSGIDELIRYYEPNQHVGFTVSTTNVQGYISFNSFGQALNHSNNFIFCDEGGNDSAEVVVISNTGRIRQCDKNDTTSPCQALLGSLDCSS